MVFLGLHACRLVADMPIFLFFFGEGGIYVFPSRVQREALYLIICFLWLSRHVEGIYYLMCGF